MFEGFSRPKTEEELKKQVNDVDVELGAEIAPREVFDKKYSVAEIKEKYPERFKIYVEILRAQKNGQEIKKEDVLEMKNWVQALNNLDSYIASHRKNHKERVLRERQFDVFTDTKQFLETGEKEGYIKLPTGIGKTVLFSQIVESMGLKTLIVVPSKILVNQTGEKLEEFTDLEFGKYYQDEKDFSKSVVTITYASLVRGIEAGIINPDDFGLLILDEVHKALGEKASKTIQKFNSIKLGFTATPKYSEKKHVNKLLEHEIHSMSITEGVQEGLINRFKSIVAYTNTDLSQVSIDNSGEYNNEQIEKAVNNQARNLSAVELYKQAFAGESAIAYCSGVDHAFDVAKLFNENGIKAESISGKTNKKERKRILDAFSAGEIQVLCNDQLLIEGYDEPRASVALNLDPTLSLVNAEQRAGRVLRLDPDNPEKWSSVVDFVDENVKSQPVLFVEIAGSSEATIEYVVEKPKEGFLGDENLGEEKDSEYRHRKFENIKINNLRVIVDAREILRVAMEQADNREDLQIEKLPEGWMTASGLQNKYGVAWKTVNNFVDQYRETNPEWFRLFRNGTRVAEAFHPDLIAIIEEKIVLEKVPEGWMTASMLISQDGMVWETINNFVNQYRETNPEWFGKFKSGSNITEAFHPELISIIREKIIVEKVPENWMTASRLHDQIKVTARIINNFVNKYRETNPDWFGKFRSGPNITEAFHPDLVNMIKENLNIEKIPEGWMTARKLIKHTKSSTPTVNNFVDQYRETNPEWFGKFKSGSNITEAFHPDLVAIFEKNSIIMPEDWITASKLANKVKASYKSINSFADQYRKDNPRWFGEFKTGSRIAEAFHPDLVEIIKEKFGKK